MSELRKRMIRDMTVRGFSPRTHEAYIVAVVRLAKHYYCRIPLRRPGEGFSPTGFIRHARRTTDKNLSVRPKRVQEPMEGRDGEARPLPEVLKYSARFPEESRLEFGFFQLEFERTKEILARYLPRPPARIIDVGGAAGAYSFWLAEQGFEVHLVDASPRLVEEARRRSAGSAAPIASLSVADARRLREESGSAAVVLIMGPLYHLPSAVDRMAALREAFRVLAMDGIAVVAAISRYASALDGLARKLSLDPRYVKIRDRDLADGQHRNDTDEDYFTTAYFHRPDDLRTEIEAAGFREVKVLGVEGPGWLLPDFDVRWGDSELRRDLLDVARALESESSIQGASAHLLGIGRKL